MERFCKLNLFCTISTKLINLQFTAVTNSKNTQPTPNEADKVDLRNANETIRTGFQGPNRVNNLTILLYRYANHNAVKSISKPV